MRSPSKPKRLTKSAKLKLIDEFVQIMRRIKPNPRCELYYETPYQLLVSVVLSAQTTDRMVNRVMEPLHKGGLTPQDVVALGEKKLLTKIKSIGLAPTKAKNIIKLTEILLAKHQGKVPHSRELLEALPGVGRKTANVILGEIFGEPTLAVDTHVFRVAFRLGLHKEATPQKCEEQLLRLVKPEYLPKLHHWLILHGRYTCKAQNPLCGTCPVREICPSVPN